MIIKGNTIYFNYNSKGNAKKCFWFGLSVILFMLVLYTAKPSSLTWKENLSVWFSAFWWMLPVAVLFFVIAFVQKNRENKGLFIGISPKGITDIKGRMISIADIDHCCLRYSFLSSKLGDQPSPTTPAKLLIVYFKNKKKKKIPLNLYDAPVFKEGYYFHTKANKTLDINLFTPCEVERRFTTYP